MRRTLAGLAGGCCLLLLLCGPAAAELATASGQLTELDGRYLLMDKAKGAVELRGEALEDMVGKRIWVSGDMEDGEKGLPVLTVEDIEVIQSQE
jgi:hypothetical protein